MLKENLKTQRNIKGFTQEELAIRLNVVRQTVSKWEKGQSVPDADLLIQIANIFEVSVSELLGTEMENEKEIGDVAQQLSRINEQLAIMNRRARRIWKTVTIVAGVVVALCLVSILLNYAITSNEPLSTASGFGATGELAKQVYDTQLADDIKTTLIQIPKFIDALVVVDSGERSPFINQSDTTKAIAHVFLTIDDGSTLTGIEAQTVADLVRGAVQGIEYEDIHIADQNTNVYEVGNTKK